MEKLIDLFDEQCDESADADLDPATLQMVEELSIFVPPARFDLPVLEDW